MSVSVSVSMYLALAHLPGMFSFLALADSQPIFSLLFFHQPTVHVDLLVLRPALSAFSCSFAYPPPATDRHSAIFNPRQVPLRLTVIDTPGFGMGIDNSKWCVPWPWPWVRPSSSPKDGRASDSHRDAISPSWKPITDVIEERFQLFEQADSQLERNDMSDSRVHCCFYFLEPCTHG